MRGVGAQLWPYRRYLQSAIRGVETCNPALAWREATATEAAEFDARRTGRKRISRNRDSKRSQLSPATVGDQTGDGAWIILEPLPNKPEERDETFEMFLTAECVFDSDRQSRRGGGIRRIESDPEGLALLLERIPEASTPTDRSEDGANQERRLWLRPDTHVLRRQKQALDSLENAPRRFHAPLIRLMVSRSQWAPVEQAILGGNDWIFLRSTSGDDGLLDGTEEQRTFVRKALGTPDFALLEGPPGSGKTTAICELIAQLAVRGKRVLLVASTHVAVDNVLERLLDWQEGPHCQPKPIMPVRIGDENRVTSDVVAPWCYGRLRKTWNSSLRAFLRKPGTTDPRGNEARSMLFEALTRSDGISESAISSLILDSSNLVCGTTIGILQHPAIKEAQRNHQVCEPFDVMILDEASKTTFSEFLVPAMHARRWVVVGDVRQLSPYVEEQHLQENLRGFLEPEIAEATLHAFETERSPRLVAQEERTRREALVAECEARGLRCVDLDTQPHALDASNSAAVLQLLHADLVCGKRETIQRWQHRLPLDLCESDAEGGDLADWRAARSAWQTRPQEGHQSVRRGGEITCWENEVAWRLIRSYELRQNSDERDKYVSQIGRLLPQIDEKIRASAEENIERVRRCAMPSILELLQSGFQRLEERHEPVVLTDGFSRQDLTQRFVSLSFQHRMHPEISAFPRERFYDGEKSGNELLRDAASMEEKRHWKYGGAGSARARWIEVPVKRKAGSDRNENRAEADVVVDELRSFLSWAESHPHGTSDVWTVAILTFYRAQEALLRKRLRKLSRAGSNTRNFLFPAKNPKVHVTLCTVDRFQGHEADLVILSFVKSGSVGFLNSPNRLNVALTRARYGLTLVGDRSFFAGKRCRSPLLKALAQSEHYPAGIAFRLTS